MSERECEVAGTPANRRSGTVVHLLVGGRRSPEGERTVIERTRGDALSREPEPINPRVDTGEQRCSGSPSQTLMGSDLATVGPSESRCTTFLMLGFQITDFTLFLFRFSSFLSNLNPFLISSRGKHLDLSIKRV
jgi:hypothetical protein